MVQLTLLLEELRQAWPSLEGFSFYRSLGSKRNFPKHVKALPSVLPTLQPFCLCWKNNCLKMTLSVISAFKRNAAWMQQTRSPLSTVYFLGDFTKCDNWGVPNFHSLTLLRSWVRFETNSKDSYNPLFRHTTSLPVMNNLNNPRRSHKPKKTQLRCKTWSP